MGIQSKLDEQDMRVFDALAKAWCSTKGIFIYILYSIIRFIILIFIIECSSESSPLKVLKIQDDEQEKVKDRDWSGLKANIFSIELEKGDDQGLQIIMT